MNCAGNIVTNALEIKSLSKRYGGQAAVDDVNLNLGCGESLAIIGHNGAGKTTLMKLILGLTRPSSGSIAHRPATTDVSAAGDSTGFLPESVAFPGTLSGRRMLRFYARLKRQPSRQCEELLDLVGLSSAAHQKINTYSKGMRQRLGLAQALLGNPQLLLLDEPTSGLDPFLRSHFYDIIRSRQQAGTSVIISSHALTEIEARTDRIAIMKEGRLLQVGSLSQLRERASLPVRISVLHQPGQDQHLLESLSHTVSAEKQSSTELLLSCQEQDKLALLHQLTSRDSAVVDVNLRPPRLDDLYTHFVNGDES